MRVLAQVVDRVAQALDGVVGPAAGIGLGAFASAPEHEDLRAQLRADVHRAHRLLDRVGAHRGIVRREGAVAEGRIEEQAHRRHRHDDAVAVAGLLELLDDAIALGGRRVDGHQVVVVQVHAPGADIGQQLHGVDRRQGGTDFGAERIAAAVGRRSRGRRRTCVRGGGRTNQGSSSPHMTPELKLGPTYSKLAEPKLGPTCHSQHGRTKVRPYVLSMRSALRTW